MSLTTGEVMLALSVLSYLAVSVLQVNVAQLYMAGVDGSISKSLVGVINSLIIVGF